MSIVPTSQAVDQLASQCVKCGLCLPHCPTYLITQDENESPRGRIALFQAVSKNQLPLTTEVQKHLDLCLGCRACETVCPAHVKYGALLTTGRTYLNDEKKAAPPQLRTRFLMYILESRLLRTLLHYGLWCLQISGLRTLFRKLHLTSLLRLSALDSLLPQITYPEIKSGIYRSLSPKRGEVMLFMGCTSPWCDQPTLSASLFVLRKLGYDVLIPQQQACCGAMALHSGRLKKALSLAQQNERAFSNNVAPIITIATGCSATLQEGDEPFSKKVIDIIDFIESQEWPADLKLKALPLRVKLHTPCSRRHVLKTTDTPKTMLSHIPEISVSLFQTTTCCGAAGTYMVEHPDMASSLVKPLLAELAAAPPDFIATSNVGCALHLQRELKKQNLAIMVGHPVMLLARALDF